MLLIINIVFILLIIRLLMNSKVLKTLMEYHWAFLLRLQHIFFFFIFILITYLTENYFLDASDLIWSIIINLIFNIGVYYLVYYYLVPYFYLSNKYPEFILYALICFLLSSLFRILWEPAVFEINFRREGSYIDFLYNIYIAQGVIILMASFWGITKDKFLIEQDVIDLEKQKDELYLNLLKSKLNPHFLLNTLNNIYANSFTPSVVTSNSILQLSKLLQYIIYDSSKEKISVLQELSSAEALAALYQLKYNNRLDLVFDIQDKETLELIEIPPSIFLTLFENALKHSAIGENPESFIRLSCKTEDLILVFEILNSFNKNKKLAVETGYNGLGNKAIIRILEKYYPEKFNFFSEQDGDFHYKTILKINLNE